MKTLSARFGAWSLLFALLGWAFVPVVQAQTSLCTYAISPSIRAHGYGASSNFVAVTTTNGCAWTVLNTNPWVTISSGTNTGSGPVSYAVAANPTTTTRSGNIVIAGKLFSITQAGGACGLLLSPDHAHYAAGASATTGSVSVATSDGCAWTVLTTNAWISVLPSNAGVGNGTVTYSVAANSGLARDGALAIGDRLFAISQSGIDCGYSLSATNRSYGAGVWTDVVDVSAASICQWIVSNTNGWISILSGGSGLGNGAVVYDLTPNTNLQPRIGNIIIAGQTLTIAQAGADFVIVGQPTNQIVLPGGSAVFSVTVASASPYVYQWHLDGLPLVDGNGISGAGTPTLTLTEVQKSQAGSYTVTVSNSVSGTLYFTASLTVSCGYTLFPNTASFSSMAANDFIVVNGNANCLWNLVNTNPWVAIVSGETNFGSGTIVYSVAANPTTVARSGRIYVADKIFIINQSGSAPTNATVSLAEALDTVGGLPWGTTGSPVWFGQTAVSHDGVDAAQSGPLGSGGAVTVQTTVSGPGTISFWWKVSSTTNFNYLKFFINGIQQLRISGEEDWQLRSLPITSPTNILKWTYSKSGTASLGLDKGWLDQVRFIPGTGCVVTLSPANATHSFNVETGQVSVAAAEGCAWAVDNTNSWINPLVQIGEGNGDFNYTATANNSPLSRTGVITVGGQPFTVVQAGNPAFCTYAISPASRAHPNGVGSGNITLTTQTGCLWDVVNTNPWVSISFIVTNASSGTVAYAVDANSNAGTRSGYMLIGGTSFLVTQAGGGTNGPMPQYAEFDAGRDFSTDQNPNGVWTFGWAGTVTGTVNPLMVRRDSPADNGASTASWQLTYDKAPVVICNISNQAVTVGGGQAALAPHEVLFDGGQDGSPENFVVIKFTAPSNGQYTVTTLVRPFYNGSPQGDADFHVVRNSTELFMQSLNPYQSAYYSNTLSMSAGETIKFLLGRGADGHEYGSIFRIAALINPRPTIPPAGFPITKFTAATPQDWEYFGFSVAALGSDRVVIGAPRRDHSAKGGAAYLFVTNGTLLTLITNPTPASMELFGYAVATVGDRIFVSSIYDSAGASYSGVVHVFNTNGTLLNTIVNPAPAYDTRFGWTMAAVGNDRVLIGTEDSGSAYLFSVNGTLLATFTPPHSSPNNKFGSSLAAVGSDLVLIGVSEDYTSGVYAGIAYLFNTNGTLLTTINNPFPAAMATFGSGVAGVGQSLLISAPGVKVGGGNAAGAAYLFNTAGTLITTFTNPTPALTNWTLYHREDFGAAVAAVGNDRVLIGAPAEDGSSTNAGTAYLFSTNGTLLATYSNSTPMLHDFFGHALAAVGEDHAIIGAYYTPEGVTAGGVPGGTPVGAAFLFSLPPAGGASTPVNLAGFDAARDFSATGNPSGAWSYGWKNALSGSFNVFPNARRAFAPNDMPYDIWEGELTLPNVMHYPWTNPLPGINGTSTLPPGTLLLDPGVEGSGKNFTVARFTAPSNAVYHLETAVAPCYDGPPQGDTDFHVVKNGVELVGQFLASPQQFSYATDLLLNAGETVDFAAGRGADNMEYGSILKLTATFAPTNPQPICTYTLLPASGSYSYSQAVGEFSVTAPAGCPWNLFNSNDWVTIASTLNNGSDRIIYAVSENTTPFARSGNIRVGDKLFFISQAAASLSVAEALDVVGTPLVVLSTGSPAWIGQTNTAHDGVDAAQSSGNATLALSASGPGTLTFWWKISSPTGNNLRFRLGGAELARITGEADWEQRTVTIPAGTQNFEWYSAIGSADRAWVDQVQFAPVAGCTVTLSPGSATHPTTSSTGFVAVAAALDCVWEAFNTNAWISITSGRNGTAEAANGMGNGSVTYVVAANPSASARSGNLRIAGQNFLVTQAGSNVPPSGCTVSISPSSRTHGAGVATGLVSVTTQAGCAWSVIETNTWISILSSLSTSNNGVTRYFLSPNTNSQTRTASIRIGGESFVVTQLGASMLGTNTPRIQFVGRSGNGAILSVQGEAGRTYVVECSEDLIYWIPISTNSAPATVTEAPEFKALKRFYRTVEIP